MHEVLIIEMLHFVKRIYLYLSYTFKQVPSIEPVMESKTLTGINILSLNLDIYILRDNYLFIKNYHYIVGTLVLIIYHFLMIWFLLWIWLSE